MIVRVPKAMESYATQYIGMARTQLSAALSPEASDPLRFKTLGHNLKGSAPSFGLVELGRLGALLEAAADDRDQEGLERAIDGIRRHLAEMEVVFE